MSLLSDFLQENALDGDAVRTRSKAIETQGAAERTLSVRRQDARRAKKKYAELSLDKPNSLGRGLGAAVLNRAIAGQPVPRLARKKITRAVNALLASQKKEPADWRKLFGDVGSKKGKSTKKKK